jgi:DNA-directed RNA polymerase subunit alpha
MAPEMESITDLDELVKKADENPGRIFGFRNRIYLDEKEFERTEKEATAELSGKKTRENLRIGIARWLTGRFDSAVEALEAGSEGPLKNFCLGLCLLEKGLYSAAGDALEKASKEVSSSEVQMYLAVALRCMGKVQKALNLLEKAAKDHPKAADVFCQRGICLDVLGEYEEAQQQYEKALELDPQNVESIFRIAYNYDLHGQDDMALQFYKKCLEIKPVHAKALMNLGVLYEDMGEYELASKCFENVLAGDPNNERARLFLEDAQASSVMFIDEEIAKTNDRKSKVLEIPITDFELSVRSRNCLEKMKIAVLGDLLKVTEQDLLSFKNFGETSLNEIKGILASKGLRLGQALEEEEKEKEQEESADVEDKKEELLNKPVDGFGFSIRSRHCFERLQIKTLGDLIEKTEDELVQCPNFGRSSLAEIKRKLEKEGLSLKAPE